MITAYGRVRSSWRCFDLCQAVPPDFDRLPAGTKELFEARLDLLPIKHVHTGIGAEAIMCNELQHLDRWAVSFGLATKDHMDLGTWHGHATHDRISAVRPDLYSPRMPSGVYSLSHPMTRWHRVKHRLVRWHL